MVKESLTKESISYKNYIYFGYEAANDPVGFIPYFQQLTTLKNAGLPRYTDFYEPIWTCYKCKDTYGLSDDKKKCLPCPDPCITCYYAKSYSCLTTK